MKKIIFVVLIFTSFIVKAQLSNYKILTDDMLKPFLNPIEKIEKIENFQYHLLTKKMINSFLIKNNYFLLENNKNNKILNIDLYFKKIKINKNYYNNSFYYNPKIYKF